MNFFKKILSFAVGCVLISKCGAVGYIDAEEAPHDIKLTCETKYIDINEIPEDRIVELNLSIDNNPGFHVLCIVIDVDSRLSYDSYNIGRQVSVNNDVRCINYTAYPDSDHQIQFDIFSDLETAIIRNGALVTLYLKLPESIQIGDFFKVEILDEFKIPSEDNTYLDTCICLEVQKESYGPESFSELNGGGIHITGEPPVTEHVPVQKNNVDQTEGSTNTEQNPNENVNSEVTNSKISNEVTTVTSSITTPAVSSSQTIVTTTPQTSVVTTVTKKITEPVTVVTTEQYEINSEKKEGNKKGINIIWLITAAVMIIVIGGSLFILIKRSKKDK